MTPQEIVNALGLPPESRVERRVPKKLLVENGAPTSSDKRQISDGLDDLLWHAALKPSNTGIPEFREASREIIEVAVLSMTLRPTARGPRLTELVHRAIPYPVLLFALQGEDLAISVANKRYSESEEGKTVLDGPVTGCVLNSEGEIGILLPNLSLVAQPRTNLLALYQGWLACIEGIQAAQLSGQYFQATSPEYAAARREALAAHARITREIAVLRARAEKEIQLNKRVELNLEIKRLNAELDKAMALLKSDKPV